MSEPRWECWAEHHEDITDRVEEAAAAKAPWAFRSRVTERLGRGESKRTLVVTCSEGHENVVDVDAS